MTITDNGDDDDDEIFSVHMVALSSQVHGAAPG